MKEMKYQPLKNNDDHAEEIVTENNNSNPSLKYYLQEYKRFWLLKFLFLCFIVLKAIYLMQSLDSQNEKITSSYSYDVTSEKIFFDLSGKTFEKYPDSSTTILSYNDNINNIQTTKSITINYANPSTSIPTTIAANNYYEIIATTTATAAATMDENTITKDNNYDNVDLTTAKLIKDSKTTISNLNSDNSINKTKLKTTAVYINKTLLQTTESSITTDPPTTSTTTTTAAAAAATNAVQRMTASSLATPVVKSSTTVKQKYFINTSHCHIPFVEPLTPEIRKIFKPKHSTGCNNEQSIVTSSFSEPEGHYILHINYTVAAGLRKSAKNSNKPIEEDLLCCYKQIVRSGSGKHVDDSFKLLPCTNFHQDFVVPMHVDGIIVNCNLKSKKSLLQEDAFAFIQVNKTLMEQQELKSKTRNLGIFMIGIDTLSRINFRRNMPETFNYLVDNKWYELVGYNKVGDNTLPNLMPLLTGYTKKTVYKKCQPTKVGGYDNCNFIWTTFKTNGYHTAYAEDSTFLSTFNYLTKGFKNPPTDYYFRPMALALEKSLKTKSKDGLIYCLGHKQFGEYIYDYGTEFANRFINQSSFGFFWTNSFSHNSYDSSAAMDRRMVKYFEAWQKQGIFENSVVIFFSDHGVRWGPLLKLPQGFLEERLPMFFISVPKWFRQQYPELVNNLQINQKRLANPFDIHMTLQHLLKLANDSYEIQQTLDCTKCQSIFEEIPENRTCEDASIPEAYCTCLPFKKESPNDKVVQTIAKLIIQEMNRYYEYKNITALCSPLQLKEITNAKWRYPDESKSSSNTDATIITYAIDFATDPLTKPKTLFSANVDYDVQNKRIHHFNIEDISRQSLYKNTAKCTEDSQAKKYCICKNSLE